MAYANQNTAKPVYRLQQALNSTINRKKANPMNIPEFYVQVLFI